MNKLMIVLAAAVAAPVFAPATAQAADTKVGAGLSVGTMVIPGKYPLKFPNEVSKNDDTTIGDVKGDVHLGFEGVYYMNESNRVGASGSLGFGSDHFDRSFLLKYGHLINFDAADFVFGGGAGVGKTTFSGDSDEQLESPYYPLRAEFGPVFRQDFLAEQVLLYTQYNITYDNTYTSADGDTSKAGVGVFWTVIGAELQVMFGNFSD